MRSIVAVVGSDVVKYTATSGIGVPSAVYARGTTVAFDDEPAFALSPTSGWMVNVAIIGGERLVGDVHDERIGVQNVVLTSSDATTSI